MAKRQRQPERRGPAKKPAKRSGVLSALAALLARGVAALGRRIVANPSLAAGASAFAVVFAFVSANALWYQDGVHPSPLIATRDGLATRPAAQLPVAEDRLARLSESVAPEFDGQGANQTVAPSGSRSEADQAQSIEDILAPIPTQRVESVRYTPEQSEITASIPPVEPQASLAAEESASTIEPDPLIRALQTELARIGAYDGEIDGLTGPKTRSAIEQYARSMEITPVPEPNRVLLAELKLAGRRAVATPTPEPAGGSQPQPVSLTREPARRSDQQRSVDGSTFIPPASVPSAGNPEPALVREIQKGLVNMAYSDVEIDGLVGSKTRRAIRHFERHYRLPETGEPSAQVLDKLREIGAL